MQESLTEEKAVPKAPRHRSPNYPAVGLRAAVDRVRKLYEKDGKAGAPANLAAVHIGYASAHGEAMAVLAALKKFGLVVPSAGRLAPSQRAIEILMLKEDDPRRIQALKDAALDPLIYRELVEQHRETGFPAADVLERELVTYKAFNPRAVAGFVKDFLDTLDFSGISSVDALDSRREVDGMPESRTESAKMPLIESGVTQQGKMDTASKEISMPVGVSDEGQAIFAHVRFDAPLKKDFLKSLRGLLEALEKGLV